MDYTNQIIADTLRLLEVNGGNVSKTASDAKIPRTTLVGWRDKFELHEGDLVTKGKDDQTDITSDVELSRKSEAELLSQAKSNINKTLFILSEKLLERIKSTSAKKLSLKDASTMQKTLFDSLRFLEGKDSSDAEKLKEFETLVEQKLKNIINDGIGAGKK